MLPNSLRAGLLLVAGLVSAADANPTRVPATIDDLRWLAGCWIHDGRDDGSVEHWLAPAGGSMLAISRIIRDDRLVSHEFLAVEETADGSLRLIAMPAGQSPAVFALAALDTAAVSFENLEHDFPQRISYRLVERDRLIARAEASRDGRITGIDFPMTRGDCESAD